MRIGVVADTHCPEFLDELPASLFERLGGVDLIVHAGDVGGPETLARLREIAPVEAVRGDHDPASLGLPPSRELELAGRRLGIVHGNRTRVVEEPLTFVNTLALGFWSPTPGLAGALRRRFPRADVIIYGHTHQPCAAIHDGALLVNPGAVYMVTREEARRRLTRAPGWFEWSWLQVMRHRRHAPRPSVGVLELGSGPPVVRILPLD
jgi:uncharacterized protein